MGVLLDLGELLGAGLLVARLGSVVVLGYVVCPLRYLSHIRIVIVTLFLKGDCPV